MPAELQVLNGELQWKRVRMAGPRCLIGRRDDCHIVLKDAWVSREHTLVIETASGEWTVQDLDSENGSYVNGVRITESPLRHLDVLRVGRTEMRFMNTSERPDSESNRPSAPGPRGALPGPPRITPTTPGEGRSAPDPAAPLPVGDQTILDRTSGGGEGKPRGDLRERVRRLERLLLEKEEENSRLASENAVFKRAMAAGGFFDPETGRFEIERLSTPGPVPVLPEGMLRFVANPLARLAYPLVEGGRLDPGESRGEPDGGVGVLRIGVVGLGDCGGRVAQAFYRIGYRHVLVLDAERSGIERLGAARRVTIGDGGAPDAWARQIAEAELRVQSAFREILGTHLTLTLLAFSLASRLGVGAVAAVRSVVDDYEELSRGASEERSQVGALVILPSREALEDAAVKERARNGADQLRKLLDAGRLSPVMLIDEQVLAELVLADSDDARDDRGQILASAVDLLQRLPALAPLAGHLDASDIKKALSGGGISTLGLGATSRTDEESLSQAVGHAFGEGLLFRGVPASRARTAVVLAQIGSEVPDGEAAVVRRLESSVAKVREILPQAVVATGIYRDDGQGVRVLGFVGGLPTPEFLV